MNRTRTRTGGSERFVQFTGSEPNHANTKECSLSCRSTGPMSPRYIHACDTVQAEHVSKSCESLLQDMMVILSWCNLNQYFFISQPIHIPNKYIFVQPYDI